MNSNEKKREKFAEKENSVYNDNEKNKNDVQEERTDENDKRNTIHESRRLSNAELDSTGGGTSDRQIRNDAENIPENTASDTYSLLMMKGELLKHLEEIDKTTTQQVQTIVSQMAKSEGITEEMKSTDPLRWTGQMNNFLHSAEEIVLSETVYS